MNCKNLVSFEINIILGQGEKLLSSRLSDVSTCLSKTLEDDAANLLKGKILDNVNQCIKKSTKIYRIKKARDLIV